MKTCTKCGESKPIDEFYADKRATDGKRPHCKSCVRQKNSEWYAKNTEKAAAYREANRERDAARRKLYHSLNQKVISEKKAAYRKNNKAAISEYMRAYREENAEALKKWGRAYREKNYEKLRSDLARYRLENISRLRAYSVAYGRKRYKERRVEILEKCKAYQKSTPHLYRKRNAKRRAAERQAVPRWVNVSAIREIYRQAATMSGVHVDHIVPLVSPIVCGLHVPENLQILPASENMSKSNRYWPDMPEEVRQ